MYYIVGDIGNTSTRVCLLKKSRIIKSIIFDTQNLLLNKFINRILKRLSKKKLRREILFSCVVPKALKKIKQDLKNKNYKVLEIKSLNLKKLIEININNINQLGSDRIVNSIEGKKFKNCLIIDFGTATTFDIVKKGVYEGGVIAPGIKISIKNLIQSTALLPIFNLTKNQKNLWQKYKRSIKCWLYLGL